MQPSKYTPHRFFGPFNQQVEQKFQKQENCSDTFQRNVPWLLNNSLVNNCVNQQEETQWNNGQKIKGKDETPPNTHQYFSHIEFDSFLASLLLFLQELLLFHSPLMLDLINETDCAALIAMTAIVTHFIKMLLLLVMMMMW
ncbi:hypothetical protein D3C80_1666240 [compost metagenome]